MNNFPALAGKILLAGLLVTGFRYLTIVSADSTKEDTHFNQDPVVAPAGTVLWVRLTQGVDIQSGRPGERFEGVLVSPVIQGNTEVLSKGAVVHGHLTRTRVPREPALSLTLDSCESRGKTIPLTTSPVARASGPSIIGFTLLSPVGV